MSNESTIAALGRLREVLKTCAPAAVAVSGGVDSMTLAVIAARELGAEVTMFHAVSAAVPPAASARVKHYAARQAWRLNIIDAHEFDDEHYLANPANRCFFCKSNLYGTIATFSVDQLLSGTNLDDLGDWRPGLKAASDHAVRHPFVEAGIDKRTVRALAAHHGLDDVAELPAAPCLSSRVETGIRIEARDLGFIDAAEQLVRRTLTAHTVRCRIRAAGIVVELDADAHAGIDTAQRVALVAEITALAAARGVSGPVDFAPYRRGSAFLR